MASTVPGTLADKQGSTPSPRHASGNVHLLVLTHGMWGNPSHLAELYRIICETKQQASLDSTSDARLEVLLAESNRDEGTYDGIDWGGERVTQEIFDLKSKLESNGETITKFSITGYSLGGLVARYVIGILYQRSFFSTVTPVNFNTFATPHIGLPGYDTLFNKLSRTLGPRLLGRTGTQFYAVDKWGPRNRPLLAIMSDPDQVFYKALCLFPKVTIYANAVNDLTVPYVTAAIEAHDPFLDHQDAGLEVEFLVDYKPVIASTTWPATPPPKPSVAVHERVVKFLTNKNPGPPFLQFGFPGNFIMWALLPLLTPLLFGIAFTRLSLSAGRSAGRIKLLEADETFSQRLVHAVADLERNLEEAIVDMTDIPSDDALRAREMDPGSKPTSGSATPALADTPAKTAAASNSPVHPSPLGSRPQSNTTTGKSAPILSPLQLKMVEQLNAIPQLQKRLVYLHPYRNTHATIVSRDVKNFEFHKAGWGGIRHWADSFQL